MGHDLFFHVLLLLGLLCLCRLLDWVWTWGRPTTGQTTPTPTMPFTQRSKAPKPFPGLTHKPRCDACEHAAESRQQVPSALPPRLTCTRGRRRAIDTQPHFCPAHDCSYYGWVGRGNIRANGHPGGGPWRQLQCLACHTYFQETYGTPLHGKRGSPEKLVWAVGALAEGLGIHAVARAFAIDPNTVLAWLIEVADYAAAFSQYFLHDVRVTQVQLDELFALLSAVKTGEASEAEAIQYLSRSPHWVWGALDPVSKLLLTIDVGERTLTMAQGVVHQVVQVLAPGCVPLFLTDGFKEYMTALLTHFGQWVQSPRRQATGPAPKPRWMPLPQLLYAQVVKQYRRRRLVGVHHRVVFGTLAGVKRVLAATGWQINTAFIERANLNIRQHVAAVGRRVTTLCKGERGLRRQLTLYQVYYNFCLPHASLRLPLAQPQPTNGTGSAKRWQPRTPAMTAGLTDRVWTLREVLLFRVPPWPQPAGV
jgi:IS1 family transposase